MSSTNLINELTGEMLTEIFEKCGVKTVKQRAFVIAYIENGGNAADAVRRAEYDTNNDNTVGYALLQKDYIQEAIRVITEEVGKRTEINPNYIIVKLKKNVERAELDRNFTATFRGLELLAKIAGLFSDKLEVTGKDGAAIEIEQRTKEDVAAFKSAIASLAKRDRTGRVPEGDVAGSDSES